MWVPFIMETGDKVKSPPASPEPRTYSSSPENKAEFYCCHTLTEALLYLNGSCKMCVSECPSITDCKS